jgi:hypothetical protein
MVVAVSQRHGEPHPSDLRVVETTLAAAERALKVRSNRTSNPIYIVLAGGHFVSSGPRPPGVDPPTGNTLHMLVTRDSFKLVGWGLSPTGGAELDALGLVHRL